MFKKSKTHKPPTLFGGIVNQLEGRKLKMLEDSQAWHNVFFREITSGIDEFPFGKLYGQKGRPNAPVRQLIAMLILKEGHGWSDEQLYNECRFNLQVMWALGLPNLDDDVPVESTYYDFKARLVRHHEQQGEDLLGQAFASLTSRQVQRFKVSGREVRMDSKLFNSNIARCTRLQLVIGVLQKFYKEHEKSDTLLKLDKSDREQLHTLSVKPATNHTYPLSNEEKTQMLVQLGELLGRIQKLKGSDGDGGQSEMDLVERLFKEQFETLTAPAAQGPVVRPRHKASIEAHSMQSPNDPDAGYREKESGQKTQKVQGFSTNITETCRRQEGNEVPPLNLIMHAQTEIVTTSDDLFFQAGILQSEAVTAQSVKAAWTDGAFNSQPNADFVEQRKDTPLIWYLSKIQGPASNFHFAYDEQGQLHVTDLRTGKIKLAHQTPKGIYRIDEMQGKKSRYRYFDPVIIRNYFRRQQIQEQPPDIRNRRASVESTVHQVFCTLKGNKSKYRSRVRNHCFVLSRCFWVNFRRIWAYLLENPAIFDQKLFEKILLVLCCAWVNVMAFAKGTTRLQAT